MHDRLMHVPEAHQGTFSWAFQADASSLPQDRGRGKAQTHRVSRNSSEDKSSVNVLPLRRDQRSFNLGKFLKQGHGIFWIYGKPGSGKSVFMKNVMDHRDPQQLTSEWAQDARLLQASYFFWGLGSSLQKSLEGMLRSLLFQILSAAPDLILALFPMDSSTGSTFHFTGYSVERLRKTFLTLISTASRKLRIVFFVDAVDECGDHVSELLRLLKLADLVNVKTVLSSRWNNASYNTFQDMPQLRLDAFTGPDLVTYIREEFFSDYNFRRLRERDQTITDTLMQEVISRACGSFLWVMLVVKSLKTGACNYDTIDDLFSRLNTLPPELQQMYEQMYEQMLKGVNRVYLVQMSMMLQMALVHEEVTEGLPLPAALLGWLYSKDGYGMNRVGIRRCSHDMKDFSTHSTRNKIISRCNGFIEVVEYQQELDAPNRGYAFNELVAEFTHGTVLDYLRQPRVSRVLISYTDGMKFDPAATLSAACVYWVSELVTTSDIEASCEPLGPIRLIQALFSFYLTAGSIATPFQRLDLERMIRERVILEDEILQRRYNVANFLK